MKKIQIVFVFLLAGAGRLFAQDAFLQELFSADAVLKYRDEIGLSTQQVESIKSIYDNHITEFNSLKWDLDAELVRLNKFLAETKPDESIAIAQMDKVLGLEEKLKKMRLSMLIKIKSELSQTQQGKLKVMMIGQENSGYGVITPINENPRVMIKVDGANAAEDPLYIIKSKNGERKAHSVADIDPGEIMSLLVLKGEEAVDIYGAEGKNGVIIIQLKK